MHQSGQVNCCVSTRESYTFFVCPDLKKYFIIPLQQSGLHIDARILQLKIHRGQQTGQWKPWSKKMPSLQCKRTPEIRVSKKFIPYEISRNSPPVFPLCWKWASVNESKRDSKFQWSQKWRQLKSRFGWRRARARNKQSTKFQKAAKRSISFFCAFWIILN